jgi:hypothetical protein
MNEESQIPARPTLKQFEAVLNEPFQVRSEGGEAILATFVLVEASPSKYQRPGAPEAFSLIFQGPADVAFHQSIYRLSNASMGELSIFIVPVGANAERREYQAIYN